MKFALLVLLGMTQVGRGRTVHCVGMTGKMCESTYPATECGLRQALDALPPEGGSVLLGSTTFVITGELCGGLREALETRSELFLPWHRYYNIDLDGIHVSPFSVPIEVGPKPTRLIGAAQGTTLLVGKNLHPGVRVQ